MKAHWAVLIALVACGIARTQQPQPPQRPDYHQFTQAAYRASASWPAPARIELLGFIAAHEEYEPDGYKRDAGAMWKRAFHAVIGLRTDPEGATPAQIASLRAHIESPAICYLSDGDDLSDILSLIGEADVPKDPLYECAVRRLMGQQGQMSWAAAQQFLQHQQAATGLYPYGTAIEMWRNWQELPGVPFSPNHAPEALKRRRAELLQDVATHAQGEANHTALLDLARAWEWVPQHTTDPALAVPADVAASLDRIMQEELEAQWAEPQPVRHRPSAVVSTFERALDSAGSPEGADGSLDRKRVLGVKAMLDASPQLTRIDAAGVASLCVDFGFLGLPWPRCAQNVLNRAMADFSVAARSYASLSSEQARTDWLLGKMWPPYPETRHSPLSNAMNQVRNLTAIWYGPPPQVVHDYFEAAQQRVAAMHSPMQPFAWIAVAAGAMADGD